jgi:hypothetical protein
MTANNHQTPTKSRNLSVAQLFDILQEEFIVCELRVKIYPLEKHKDYWRDLMQKKKDKIIDIARKNALFSIFDDIRIKSDYESKIILEIGFPRFIYKDDAQRLLQEKWDVHNYYLPKSEVRVYDQDVSKTLVGKIHSVDFKNQVVKINFESESKDYNIESVTRVF